MKVCLSQPLPSAPTSCTVSKTPEGRYYVSFLCSFIPKPTSGQAVIGVDLGIKDYATLSTGAKVANDKYSRKYAAKLRRAQQTLSRRQKGSKNRTKAQRAVARIHAKIANCRSNFQHQLSRSLVNDSQVIGLETLMVANMLKNRKLSRAIADTGWSSFVDKVIYKAAHSQHCTVVKLDSFYPSSQLCSCCKQRPDEKLKLSDRSWTCPHCGTAHDRDVNAAINIRDEAMQILATHGLLEARGQLVLGTSKH